MNQDKVYDKTLYDNLDYERDKIRRIENQVKAKPTEKRFEDSDICSEGFWHYCYHIRYSRCEICI